MPSPTERNEVHALMKPDVAVTALAALAQSTRLAIYRLLVQQGPSGLAAGEIGAHLKIPPATLSFHLKELARARIIKARQDGRFIFYSADFRVMNALLAYLAENCCTTDAATAGCAPAPVCAAGTIAVTAVPIRQLKSKRKATT